MEKKSLADHKSQIVARIKSKGKTFEILVDSAKAIEFKKTGKGFIQDIIIFDGIFYDYKKGLKVKEDELEEIFGTKDLNPIYEKIIKQGELMLPLEFRKEARDEKMKQIVDFLAKNCVDPKTSKPHPPARIQSALEQVGFNVKDNEPSETQARTVLKLIQKILPIKIETKRIEIKLLSIHAARAYGIVKDSIMKEEWLPDGSLVIVVELPAASLMDFFDKLNAITHGSAITKEI
ncbi:MAG: ribosome assembly factor SBDS [Nanoarchaeota archaeon]|nr:ribosome assembly factor SBDS [Nanoarchaeota archaeon]